MGDRARRRTRQPHSAARLLQGVAAGRQPSRSGRGAALRRQRVSGRAHDPGRGGKNLLRDLARQVGHHGVLWGGLRRRRDRLRGAAAPERVVRRHLPRRAADPGRRSRDRRPARHDLVSRRRRSPTCRTTCCPSCSFPSSSPSSSTRSCSTRPSACGKSRSSEQDAASNWIWGAFKMPGRVLATCATSGTSAAARTNTSARWSTPISRAAAWRWASRRATRLRRCRHAQWLSGGDRPARGRRGRRRPRPERASRSAGPTGARWTGLHDASRE